MPFFSLFRRHDPAHAHQHKLEWFHKSFLHMIADGTYPPERQQWLFVECKRAGLDWDMARRFVRADARAFLWRYIRAMVATRSLTDVDLAEIQRLQRRFGLCGDDVQQILDQLAPPPITIPSAPPIRLSTGEGSGTFEVPMTVSGLVDNDALKARVMPLSPVEFEEWTCAALIYLGWQNVKHVGGSRDRGVDVRGEWKGKRCIVQCKHYRGKLVPPGDVRGVVGTRNIHRAQRAYLITSGRFGYQCFVEIQGKPVELWDLDTLAVHLSNTASR